MWFIKYGSNYLQLQQTGLNEPCQCQVGFCAIVQGCQGKPFCKIRINADGCNTTCRPLHSCWASPWCGLGYPWTSPSPKQLLGAIEGVIRMCHKNTQWRYSGTGVNPWNIWGSADRGRTLPAVMSLQHNTAGRCQAQQFTVSDMEAEPCPCPHGCPCQDAEAESNRTAPGTSVQQLWPPPLLLC